MPAADAAPAPHRRGASQSLVRSAVAHPQGMSLLALAYHLLGRPMQRRFASDPLFQATLLLLQERIPRASAFYTHNLELADIQAVAASPQMPIRVLNAPDTPVPFSPPLEEYFLPNVQKVVEAARKLAAY